MWHTVCGRVNHCREIFWFLLLRGLCSFGVLIFLLPFMRRNNTTKENHGTKQWSSAAPLKSWEKFVLKYRIPFIEVNKDYNNYNLKMLDPIGPEFWSLLLRGCRFPCTYWLVWALDITAYLACLWDYWCYKNDDPDDKGDDYDQDTRVRIMKCITWDKVYTTFWAEQGIRMIAKTDPQKHLDAFYSKKGRAPVNEWLRYPVRMTFDPRRKRG